MRFMDSSVTSNPSIVVTEVDVIKPIHSNTSQIITMDNNLPRGIFEFQEKPAGNDTDVVDGIVVFAADTQKCTEDK